MKSQISKTNIKDKNMKISSIKNKKKGKKLVQNQKNNQNKS